MGFVVLDLNSIRREGGLILMSELLRSIMV